VLATAAPLVGRRDELAAIDRAMRALDGRRCHVLEIHGEPGIGKSRLVAEVCARAEARSALVLAGRAAEFERSVPFGVFMDALDDYLGTINPRRLERLGPESIEELAQIFPSLAELAGQAGPPATERFRSHRAVRLLLDALAVHAPVVLALDDLHWADPASLELLTHLLRKRSRQPVLLVLAYRSGQAPRQLAAALAQAVRDGDCEQVEPGALSRDEVEELVGAELDRHARDALFRDSGGNPFYLEELARDARRTGGVGHGLPAARLERPDGTVPGAVAVALENEVESLAPATRAVALAAAVSGDPFVPSVVGAVAELEKEATLAALDELLDADLIRPTEVPLRFRFRHPIVRHALYEHAGAAWRIDAHARAAAALAAAGAPAIMRAHHVERSAALGDADAIALLKEAGHAAGGRAPATSATWFAAALRLLPETAETAGQRIELLVPLALAHAAAGDFDAARATLDDLLALIPPELATIRARLTAKRTHIQVLRGDHGSAAAFLKAELASYTDDSPVAIAELKMALGADRFFANDWEEMRTWALGAVETGRTCGDPSLHGCTAAMAGGAEYLNARLDDCRRLLDEAAATFDALGDPAVADRLEGIHWLGWTEAFVDRYEESLAHLTRGIEVGRATGRGHLLTLLVAQANTLLALGLIAEAQEAAETAHEIALLSGNDQFVSWALTILSTTCLAVGDVAAATEHGARATELAGNDPVAALAPCAYGEALIAGGEPEKGRDAMLRGVGGPEMPHVERPFRSRWYEPLAHAEIALGRLDAAAGWARLSEETAGRHPEVASRQAEMLRTRAALALAAGDPRAAAEAARAALAASDQVGMPIEAARARTLLGQALAETGDAAAALDDLERARAQLAERGALRHRDAAARELRRLGRRVPRAQKAARGRAAAGGALSPREREVAELVRSGKTNRQIASELFLSEKTVETHLSHVFAKLGVSSRAAVAGSLAATD
jgi:ATP/maltotriose-dependent transcriptional regulator MalT